MPSPRGMAILAHHSPAAAPLTPFGRVMAVPGTVIYFSTYDLLRDATAQRLAPDLAPMVSGATARGA